MKINSKTALSVSGLFACRRLCIHADTKSCPVCTFYNISFQTLIMRIMSG